MKLEKSQYLEMNILGISIKISASLVVVLVIKVALGF